MLGEILILAGGAIDRSKEKDETSVENFVYVFGLFCAFFLRYYFCVLKELKHTSLLTGFFANGCSLRESRRKQI